MLESVAPWMNSRPKEDVVSWKELYVQLSDVRCLKHGAKYFDLRLTTEDDYHFNNVHFKDDYLFAAEANTRKVKYARFEDPTPLDIVSDCNYSLTDQPVTFTDDWSEFLQQKIVNSRTERDEAFEKEMKQLCVSPVETDAYNTKYGCEGFSTWMNDSITYHKLDPFGEEELNIRGSDGEIKMHLAFDKPIRMIRQIVFNEKQVVILFNDNKLCAIYIKDDEPSFNDVMTLRLKARKIEMLDNLLVVLYTDGCLESAEIVGDPRLTLTDFRPIVLEEFTTGMRLLAPHVTDFIFYGLAFVAISNQGDLYVSVLDRCDHNSICRNCLQPYRLRTRDGALLNRLSATSSQGLKLAVLEQLHMGPFWSTIIHIIYIRKNKP